MTGPTPTPTLPTAAETTEVLRFLHRFADLMSNGSNSENLLRAAHMLEAHIGLLHETNELLSVERGRGEAGAEIRRVLEARVGEFENEIVSLKLQLAGQQARVTDILTEMEQRQSELLQRAEEAEALLALAQATPQPAMPFGAIPVPLTALQVARAQFESLARAFEKSGNIVSQVMCEASASSIERTIRDAGVAEPDDRSKHAA